MKINTRARYAVRLMADIHKYGKGEIVPLKNVAKRQGLSRQYLSQLTVPLKTAGLLKSVSGMNGGYKLSRDGSKIKILEILEAIEGPVSIIDCLSEEDECIKNDVCECRALWKEVNDTIIWKLDQFTLEDLINKK